MRFIGMLLAGALSLSGCLMSPDDGEGEGPPPSEEKKDCKQICADMPDMCRSCQQAPEFDDGVSPDPLPWRPSVPPSSPHP